MAPAAAPPTVPITVPFAALLHPFFFVAVVPALDEPELEAVEPEDDDPPPELPEDEFLLGVDFLATLLASAFLSASFSSSILLRLSFCFWKVIFSFC